MHPLIFRPRTLFYRTDCTRRSKFLTHALSDEEILRFILLEEKSYNGAPRVSIVFPNDFEDNLVLNQFYANQEDRMADIKDCNFIGHLENEPKACVAMTGCVGSEDWNSPFYLLILKSTQCLNGLKRDLFLSLKDLQR